MQAQQILVEDIKTNFIKQLNELEKERDESERVEDKKKFQERIDSIKNSIKSLEKIGKKTFWDLRLMIWIVYIIGIVLIGLSIYNFLIDTSGSFVFLGMGTLGIVDIFAVLFYNPMNRLQKANSDLIQQIMVQISYTTVQWLRDKASETKDPDERNAINETAKEVKTDLSFMLNLLEKHLEIKP